jgi:hypothetical protein
MAAPANSSGSFHAENLTAITYRKRSLAMYPILDSELRELVSGYSSINLALFGITIGVFVSTLLTYLTVPLSVSLSTNHPQPQQSGKFARHAIPERRQSFQRQKCADHQFPSPRHKPIKSHDGLVLGCPKIHCERNCSQGK